MAEPHYSLDPAFPHAFECHWLRDTPSNIAPYYYPGASRSGGRDGMLVHVRPQAGDAWVGLFGFGDIDPKGVSGLFTTPDPGKLCVVARGQGYLVSAAQPSSWEEVRAVPVRDVKPAPSRGLLIFASYTDLTAYGASGLQWRTPQLSWDNIRIVSVAEDVIHGEFWDVRTEALTPFMVDLSTGADVGGLGEL